MIEAVKQVVLLAIALVTTAVVGFQWMGQEAHIPQGSRLLTVSAYMGQSALAIGLICTLFLISKKNRNVRSYLKAYVLLGLLVSLGGCGSWMKKFHGKKKQLQDATGLSVEVPSDWALAKAPEGFDLFAMDWAGTNSVGVTAISADEAPESEDHVAGVLASVLVTTSFNDPGDDFRCGDLCLGKQFKVVSGERPMRLLLAVKYENSKWLMLNGGVFESNAVEDVPVTIDIMATAK